MLFLTAGFLLTWFRSRLSLPGAMAQSDVEADRLRQQLAAQASELTEQTEKLDGLQDAVGKLSLTLDQIATDR